VFVIQTVSQKFICKLPTIATPHIRCSINIPAQRRWQPLDLLCPFLGGGECPRDKLVDVEPAIKSAVEIVAEMTKKTERVPPIVISRVYRGGKTTLIDILSKKLSESR
jgi:hypothetical protein